MTDSQYIKEIIILEHALRLAAESIVDYEYMLRQVDEEGDYSGAIILTADRDDLINECYKEYYRSALKEAGV
jgi:hypothetical protein